MRRLPSPGQFLLLFVVWSAAFAPCQAVAAEGAWMTDFDAALAEAQRLQRPLLVHFYTDWCQPCQQMERTVLNRPEVADSIRRSIIAVKVNAEKSPKVAARYGVDAFPMDIFVEPNGSEMMKSTGKRTLSEYKMAIARAATRYADLVASRTPPPRQQPPVQAAPLQQEPPVQAAPPTQLATQEREPLLNGYCPVTLWNNRRWEKGSPQFKSEHRGQVYLMSSEAALKEFNDHPERFSPRFLGCDPVIVYESDRAVLGSTRFAAFYDDELFLFVNDINRQAFKRNPDNFVRTQVVLNIDQIETVTK